MDTNLKFAIVIIIIEFALIVWLFKMLLKLSRGLLEIRKELDVTIDMVKDIED